MPTLPVVGRKPPRSLSAAVSLALIVVWGALRLWLFHDFLLPLTYTLPLLIGAWTRDRLLLWGMAGAFVAMHTVHQFALLPAGALPPPADTPTYLTTLINILVGAIAVHLIIAMEDRLAGALGVATDQRDELERQNEEMSQQAEELSQQAEEMSQQAEEMSQQSEELARQNEELQAQASDIQSLNVELGRRENLLQSLLDSARLAASERAALHDVCAAALEMVGPAAAVVVYEKQADRLVIRTTAGLEAEIPESIPVEHRFAELVIEQNRTASLNDAALRPDLALLAVPGDTRFRSVLGAPMQSNHRAFGAVAIYGRQPVEWTAEQFRMADWLAAQCAHILDILRLQADLRRQAALIDLSPDAIIVRRVDGTITSWGHGAEQLYGWTKAEAIGQTTHALLKTRFPEEDLDAINRRLEQTGRWSGELRHSARDGHEVVVESRWLAQRDQAGRIVELLESNVDLTARRRAEQVLRANEEQLRLATTAAEIGAWSWTPGTSHVVVSANWRRLFGVAPDVAVTFETWTGALHPDDRERAVRELNQASRQQREFDTEYRVVRPDGSVAWLVDRGRAWYDPAGRAVGMAGINIDITERKRVEEALRESQSRYDQLFENLLDGFAYCRMVFDEERRPVDFTYLRVNQAFERLTGLHNVVGRHVTDVIPGIRHSNPELLEIYGRVATTGIPEEFEVYLEPLKMWLSIAVYRPEPDHFVAVFDNITERRRALDGLQESDRRKSEFLATLSHELRNPLAPIRYALELLRCEDDDGAATHPKRVIERQLGHLVHLVDDLLDVTRIASNKIRLRIQRVNLADVVQHAVEATAPDVEQANHSLVVSLPADPLWIDADPDRLAQVLTNLLNNAARYTPNGGRLAVTAAPVHDEVAIAVSDSGIGLRPEDRERVFEMFTQVGEPGQGGLGIGLALVKGLVELHGGHIDVRSDGPGHGSQFLIRLPRAHAPAPDVITGATAGTQGLERRVLVVDDNLDSADMLKTFLEMHGHEVRVANDAVQALAVLEEFLPDIGLFDIGLPGMSGYDLARRLRQDRRYDGVFLVAVTGWGQEEDRLRARECGFDAHLTKPADPSDLHRVIAEAGNGANP